MQTDFFLLNVTFSNFPLEKKGFQSLGHHDFFFFFLIGLSLTCV